MKKYKVKKVTHTPSRAPTTHLGRLLQLLLSGWGLEVRKHTNESYGLVGGGRARTARNYIEAYCLSKV